MCSKRTRYRFLHRGGDTYYWEAVVPTDSRTEQVNCNVQWFWTGQLPS